MILSTQLAGGGLAPAAKTRGKSTTTRGWRLGGHIKQLEFPTQSSRSDPDHEFLDLEILHGLDSDLDSTLPQRSARINSRQENEIRSNIYVKVPRSLVVMVRPVLQVDINLFRNTANPRIPSAPRPTTRGSTMRPAPMTTPTLCPTLLLTADPW